VNSIVRVYQIPTYQAASNLGILFFTKPTLDQNSIMPNLVVVAQLPFASSAAKDTVRQIGKLKVQR
jgi:hypothetical protein